MKGKYDRAVALDVSDCSSDGNPLSVQPAGPSRIRWNFAGDATAFFIRLRTTGGIQRAASDGMLFLARRPEPDLRPTSAVSPMFRVIPVTTVYW
jgi:hypothetical protein